MLYWLFTKRDPFQQRSYLESPGKFESAGNNNLLGFSNHTENKWQNSQWEWQVISEKSIHNSKSNLHSNKKRQPGQVDFNVQCQKNTVWQFYQIIISISSDFRRKYEISRW